MENNEKSKRGFTLIELLVVIAVISLLASVVMVSFPGATKKARDAERLQAMHQILTALTIYKANEGQYPGPTSVYGESEGSCGGWDTSTVDNDGDGKPFIEPLIDTNTMNIIPTDPVGTGTCGGLTYRYYRYGAGSYGCDSSKGAFFVLGVHDMEASGRPHTDSPGWSCSNRNWQNEFDWVTGGFEK